MLLVQCVQVLRYIVIIGVKDGIAFGLPPEPVLHHSIQGDVLIAITLRDLLNFVEGDISILGLEESESPLRKHGSMTAHASILMDDSVHLRSINHVIIHGRAGDRAELQFQREAVIDIGQRRCVPKDCIALAGNEKRNRDVGVVLSQFNSRPTIIEQPALMLSQSVDRLGCIGCEAVGYLPGVLSVQLNRFISTWYAVSFMEECRAISLEKARLATLPSSMKPTYRSVRTGKMLRGRIVAHRASTAGDGCPSPAHRESPRREPRSRCKR
jgi:hypothetical protein